MFLKLALRNVTRGMRDYSVYFLTLTFGVCVFYMFNSLGSQPAMTILASSDAGMVKDILLYMDVLSVFVSVVLACLVLYANRFMLRRRKKELGTYLLLGLPLSKLSLLLFCEVLLIGILALVTGIALGIFGSLGLSALTLSLFQIDVPQLGFVFSGSSVGKTILYFSVMFLVVMVFNQISVARRKLIDLMTDERKNEVLKNQSLPFSVLHFLLGVALLLSAYAILLLRGILALDKWFLVMLFIGALGTLLFFRGLSGFILQLCRRHETLYYKNLNMFVLRQWSGKIHSTYLSMTVICIMLLLAIGISACSLGLNNAVDSSVQTYISSMSTQEIQDIYGGYDNMLQSVYLETAGSKLLVLYMGLYLGMIFLLSSAAVLALQQLSQTADNIVRYQILARLGTEERMRGRAVFAQIFLAFFLPLALAVVHAAVGITAANSVIAQVGQLDTGASSVLTACFILVIYGTYFLLTFLGSRRILRERR
ncbi:MAG: hypothetical protein H6Q60_844 [Oscillospiraceae bacterium]|nr:hypothetical protein [Oscillospiraceae bacterium]